MQTLQILKDKEMDMQNLELTYQKEYKSGLRFVLKRIPGLLSVSMGIIVGTGSVFESEAENGISHFLEHMMFKGTQKRTAFEISNAMDKIGAQVNAFTSKDITCYYAKTPSESAAQAFEILADLFLHSNFPLEEMQREKGVVLEEIAMTEDTPDELCMDILAEAYFGNSGYGKTILGSSQNVQGFTQQALLNYIQDRYNAKNIVVSIAGNIDLKEAEALVEQYLESVLEKRPFKERNKEIVLTKNHLFKVKEIEQVHLALAYPSVAREDEKMEASLIINSVLGGGMSSRLFQKVREEMGLAYTVYSYISSFTEGGQLTIYAGVNAKNLQKATDAILNTVADIQQNLFTEEEFLRGKAQLKSSIILGQENTATQMIQYGKHMLYNNALLDIEKRVAKIEALTLEDCKAAMQANFDKKYLASAVVGKVDKALVL